MQKQHILGVTVALLLAVPVFSALSDSAFAQAPDPRAGATTPVQVMNGTANPVPVVGNVTVTNTLNGNVKVTNTSSSPVPTSVIGNINLSPGTLVGIDPTQNVVNVKLPTVQPFQVSGSLSFGPGAVRSAQWTFTVPTGKILAIEYVSGSFTKQISSSGEPDFVPFVFHVTTTTGGQTFSHAVPVRGVFTESPITWFEVASPVRLYADGGTIVTVSIEHVFSGGYVINGSAGLSGQLRDAL